MPNTEHTILAGEDAIEIRLELLDKQAGDYTISSDSPLFAEIFNTDNFRLQKDNVEMDHILLGKVIPRLKSQAEQILKNIHKVL